MKIVVSGYVGKKITGIGRNLICLLDNVSSNNEYIVYVNQDMRDEFKFNNPRIHVKTYKVSKMSSLGNLIWTTFFFPFIVLKEKADVALIPNFTLLLFKFKPTVVIMHDLIEFNIKDKFSRKKMFYRTKIADPITAKRANRIITVSENSKKDIKHFLNIPEKKISVVYNGVDRNKFHKMEYLKGINIIENRKWPHKFILYAGTIDHPGKNAMSVIKAFEQLRNSKEYDGKLILAGMPGAGFEVVKNYVENSEYVNEIIITGFVTDDELIALYSSCDVFCFVSLYEGFGIPPLEALACGAKVIVSNSSSLPEVVGNVGIAVEPKDIDQIKKGIKAFIEGKINFSEREIDEHLRKYNWKILSEEFEKILIER